MYYFHGLTGGGGATMEVRPGVSDGRPSGNLDACSPGGATAEPDGGGGGLIG